MRFEDISPVLLWPIFSERVKLMRERQSYLENQLSTSEDVIGTKNNINIINPSIKTAHKTLLTISAVAPGSRILFFHQIFSHGFSSLIKH